MRKWIVFLFVIVFPISLKAEDKPRLVVGITVSQFYPEWLALYGHDLSEGGFKRLAGQGREVKADYEYMYSQTGVDHATIYSGMSPSEHGIVAHEWYDRLRGRRVSNVLDGDTRLIGEEEEGEGMSPRRMQALTLGCVMRMNNSFSKVYSIGVNEEEAVLSGGSCANLALWLSDKTGKWISSNFYADSLPGWLREHNGKLEADQFIRRGWMPVSAETENLTAMKLKSKVGLNNGFYYDLVQAKRKYDTYKILKATPYVNTMVVDLAGEVLKNEQLGRDNDADLLALNFSCLDYMNRDYGIYSREFQDVVVRLDRDIERLLAMLDERVGKGNYTVFLTFSEARELLPEDLQKVRLEAGYFSIFKAVALTKSFLSVLYGEGDWILDYDASQIYLDRGLLEKKKIPVQQMQDKVADFLIEFEGISRVVTAHALTHNTFAAGEGILFQHAFSQKRSGDILYSLQPMWVSQLKDKEDNYARYSKRNRVPLYLYGVGSGALLPADCPMVSLLPALCRLLGLPEPYFLDR